MRMVRLRWLLLATLACVSPACSEDNVVIVEREGDPALPGQASVGDAGAGEGGSTTASQASCAEGERSCDEPPPSPQAGGSGGDDEPGGGGSGGDGTGGASSADTALPDLVLDGAYLRDTTSEDFVDVTDACLVAQRCTTGTGRRRVVRFGTRTGNLGTADLVMGKPGESNPYWSFDSCHMNY